MSSEQLRANDIAQMKGSSSWLTALPLKQEGYVLSKRHYEFFDALALRYHCMGVEEVTVILCMWETVHGRSCYFMP